MESGMGWVKQRNQANPNEAHSGTSSLVDAAMLWEVPEP